MAEGGQRPIIIHIHQSGDQIQTTRQTNIRAGVIEQVGLSTAADQAPDVNEEVIEENEQPNLATDSSKCARKDPRGDVSSELGKMRLTEQYVDNYWAEEKAKALMKDSKFNEAIALLQHLPPTQGQQMKLMECYFQRNRNSDVLKCIENMKTLVVRQPRPKAVDVYNLGLENSKKSSHIKAMSFFACAAKIYPLESNSDDTARGIANCSHQCGLVIRAMIEQNERMRILASDVGMEIMNGFVDDATSVENSDPDVKADIVARFLNHTGFCYHDLKNSQRAIEFYKRGIEIMNRQFGENSSKYQVFGNLLNNMGFANENLGNYSEAETLYKRAIDAKQRVENWANDELKKKSIETTETHLRIVRSKMKSN